MILDEIVEKTRERVAQAKAKISFEEMRRKAEGMSANTGFPLIGQLKRDNVSFICEVKKASPSKGVIAEDFPYLQIAEEYEKAGAAAVSCLTEPHWFLGKNEYLEEIAEKVNIPVLRKDFTVDEYMIYEAKTLGAAAVLLICAILSEQQLSEYLKTAHSLGLSALVEAHNEQEIEMAVNSGAEIIGVNNRDLKTFSVSMDNLSKLRNMVPRDRIFVAESGITTPKDVQFLREIQADGALVGEALMRAENKKDMLDRLRGF